MSVTVTVKRAGKGTQCAGRRGPRRSVRSSPLASLLFNVVDIVASLAGCSFAPIHSLLADARQAAYHVVLRNAMLTLLLLLLLLRRSDPCLRLARQLRCNADDRDWYC